MLRKITLHVAVFRRVKVDGIIGVSDTLSLDRTEDTHFWFDEDNETSMRPVDAVMRAMTYHMHHVDFMVNTSMLTGWHTEWFDAHYEPAEWQSATPTFRQVRNATVVDRNEDEELVTIVWQGTMNEETFSSKEWERRKRIAKEAR